MHRSAAPPGNRTRVLVIDDHVLFAESLELALTVEGYDVRRWPGPGERPSTGQLLSQVYRWRPKVALLDLDLGALGHGTALINPLARTGTNVVVVTASLDRGQWGECLRYGARKTIAKTRPLGDIVGTVRRLSLGQPVLDPREREMLLRAWHLEREQQQEERARLASLTLREQEVLGHLVAGHPVREIAQISVVSEATVRSQVKSILAKLDVTSQLAAVGVAHHVGWHPPPR